MADEDYEWIQTFEFGSYHPTLLRGECLHRRVIPVRSIQGEIVAGLCMNPGCAVQLPTTFVNAGIS